MLVEILDFQTRDMEYVIKFISKYKINFLCFSLKKLFFLNLYLIKKANFNFTVYLLYNYITLNN